VLSTVEAFEAVCRRSVAEDPANSAAGESRGSGTSFCGVSEVMASSALPERVRWESPFYRYVFRVHPNLGLDQAVSEFVGVEDCEGDCASLPSRVGGHGLGPHRFIDVHGTFEGGVAGHLVYKFVGARQSPIWLPDARAAVCHEACVARIRDEVE